MSKKCPVTNKTSKMAGRYSNRVRATKFNPIGNKVRKQPNLQKKKIFIPELDKTITLKLSTKAIKNISKNGAYRTLKQANLI